MREIQVNKNPNLSSPYPFNPFNHINMTDEAAYCFGYREGWLFMMVGFLIGVLANRMHEGNHLLNSPGILRPSSPDTFSHGQDAQVTSFPSCTLTIRGLPEEEQNLYGQCTN